MLPINQEILDYNINQLQLYHDRFGFEINSYLMKKNKERNGFLMKTQLYNQKNNSNFNTISTYSNSRNKIEFL